VVSDIICDKVQMMNHVREILAMGVKSEKLCSALPSLSVGLVVCLKPLGVYKRATGHQGRFL
jgi:hypothetical protein